MSIMSGISEFIGLDIGTTAIRFVLLKGSGANKTLVKYGQVAMEGKLVQSDSKADQQKVAQAIHNLLEEQRISTKNVAVGVPSSRVFTTVVDIDRLPADELSKTIRFQADSLIPTPIDDSKIDWALLGPSPKDKTKDEILLSSVANQFVEERLDLLESIGLNVIAFEPDNLALSRALINAGNLGTELVLDIGSKTTDLVIVNNGMAKLTRSIPTGIEAIINSAMQNLNIDNTQAQQFVFKFGVSKDKLEGQVYKAIIGIVDTLVSEVEKSMKFFNSRYPDVKIEKIIVTGGASAMPEFPLYLANKFNISVEIGNAWRNISSPANMQNELATVSSQFGVAAGLAERSE